MLSVHSDIHFMKQAILEANKAFEKGEIPVGAVVVCENQIIARAHNQTQLLNDVTAHAEMLAITAAADHLGNKYLHDCTLYVTLEPCPMCAGAAGWAQFGKIVYGANDDKKGFMIYGKRMLHPRTKVEFGISHQECAELMTSFFEKKRS
ncbi:MAG: nucleoside deaminase [Saprospiraceae bacterium]